MDYQELEVITATKIAESKRIPFLPRHVGNECVRFESYVYSWMKALCETYQGGYWDFYELSNGGFYMALRQKHPMRLMVSGNWFDDELSADGAGIVATLFALNHLAQSIPRMVEKYYQLRDYIEFHPEARKIYAAID